MRAIIGVTIAATKKIFHFIYLYNILYYLHIDHKYPNYIIGHQKIRWGVILPKNRTNTDRPKSVITYNLSKNSSYIPKLSSSSMYSMTSNCCSFFFRSGSIITNNWIVLICWFLWRLRLLRHELIEGVLSIQKSKIPILRLTNLVVHPLLTTRG